VLRGGYGISYFPEPYAAGNLLGQDIPLSVSQSFTNEVTPSNFNNVTLISRPFRRLSSSNRRRRRRSTP